MKWVVASRWSKQVNECRICMKEPREEEGKKQAVSHRPSTRCNGKLVCRPRTDNYNKIMDRICLGSTFCCWLSSVCSVLCFVADQSGFLSSNFILQCFPWRLINTHTHTKYAHLKHTNIWMYASQNTTPSKWDLI